LLTRPCSRERLKAPNVEWFLEDGEHFSRHIQGRPHCISNLPYAHYYRLALALFEYEFARLCFTLQDDVFRRFSAPPGTEAYGPLAVMAQTHYRMEKLFDVPRSAFLPAPRVDSTFFALLPIRSVREARRLDAALKQLFSRRRKKGRAVGIDSDERVERLPPDVLLKRANELLHGE
jgi:16S rRNA (adenine1518-N6/adenine1519-N6)-dimethyltransferase